MEKLDGFLRIKDAAKYLGVSPNTLRNWGRSQKLTEHRHPVNNYRLYRESDLAKLLKRLEQSASKSPRRQS
jgi:excisionase family DNA binding protein